MSEREVIKCLIKKYLIYFRGKGCPPDVCLNHDICKKN